MDRGLYFWEYMNTYAGETDAKRVARTKAFSKAKEFMKSYGTERAMGITLAGPTCSDHGAMKHIIGLKENDMVFVEHKKETFETAKLTLSEIKSKSHLYLGELHKALAITPQKYNFMNFDLCGRFNQSVEDALIIAGNKLLTGGIISLTFERARENDENDKYWKQTEPFGYLLPEEHSFKKQYKKTLVNDRRRYGGYAFLVQKYVLGDDKHHMMLPIYDFKYWTGSPMAIIGFQKIIVNPKDRKNIYAATSGRATEIKKESLKRELKETALDLRLVHGYTSKQVGEIMNVPSGRIAAWMAHATRGTY